MSELENTAVPTLANDLDMWTQYVDDTFAFMKANQQTEVLRKLNSFHPSIHSSHMKKKRINQFPFWMYLLNETVKIS